MATTEILQFAGGGSANVTPQVDYAALTTLLANGFSAGIVSSAQFNKVIRQCNFISAGIAAFCVDQGISVPDDGDLPGFVTEFKDALAAYIAALSTVRTRLSADTTYYVATTGSDTTGTGAVGSPWKTIQKAVDYILTNVDPNGYKATIQVADGTYTDPVRIFSNTIGSRGYSLPGATDACWLYIKGNTTTPSNCIISTTSANCFTVWGATVRIEGFELRTTTSGNCLDAYMYGVVNVGKVVFGACADFHTYAAIGAFIKLTASYTISGAARTHYAVFHAVTEVVGGLTVTITGTPAFSSPFANLSRGALLLAAGTTFSGSATGVRYSVVTNAVLDTGGGGATYLPGDSAGGTSTGGQYV